MNEEVQTPEPTRLKALENASFPVPSACPDLSKRISDEEAKEMFQTFSLPRLAQRAEEIRYLFNPTKEVTYLVDRNINYTNICNSDCTFCAFYRPSPSHPEAYTLSKEVMRNKLQGLVDIGGTRVLLQGGHNDELPFDFYVDMVGWIKKEFPQIEINAFSPSEIEQMERVSGMNASAVLSELKAAGLAGLPGGGAELLDDEIRKRVSPKKITASRWIEIMEVAQSLELTTTATMVIGFGETIEHRLNHLRRLRELQDRSLSRGKRGFNLFISWSLKLNENTSMGRSRHRDNYGVTTLEYLRNLALARVYLDNIPHHQSSWPTLGAEIAQLGLQMGCDDIGSTMMEENVVSQAGAPTKERWFVSPAELEGYIRGAGFIPVQRDSSFNKVKSAA